MSTVYVAILLASAVLGIWWIRDRAPTLTHAIFFIVCSDVLTFLGTVILSAPESRICGTIYFGMIAMLTAFLLGWRLLMAQAAFALTIVVGYAVEAVVVHGRSLLDLYIFIAPAVTVIASLPTIIQVLIEFGRRGIGQVYTERNRDQLTGLYNRHGIRQAFRTVLRKNDQNVGLVAMLDLDRFKEYNDAHGHLAGDTRLRITADTLKAALSDALIGRVGGDEFIVIVTRRSPDALTGIIDALRALVSRTGVGPPPIEGRVGICTASSVSPSALNDAIAIADAALYEAKRDPANYVAHTGL